jgi:LPS sulfotransferase NodH
MPRLGDFDVQPAAYVIACLERTGSNLLCGALRATGRLGDPDEWFGRSKLHSRMDALGQAHPNSTAQVPKPRDFACYVEALGAQTMTGPVFGLKLHWYQYVWVTGHRWASSLYEMVPKEARANLKVVRIRRDDLVAQAISIFRANKTGIYVRPADGSAVAPVHHAAPYWNQGSDNSSDDANRELDEIISTIRHHNALWDAQVHELGVPVIETTYEMLATGYESEVRRVMSFIAGHSSADLPVVPPTTLKQADLASEELGATYRAWAAGRPVV